MKCVQVVRFVRERFASEHFVYFGFNICSLLWFAVPAKTISNEYSQIYEGIICIIMRFVAGFKFYLGSCVCVPFFLIPG